MRASNATLSLAIALACAVAAPAAQSQARDARVRLPAAEAPAKSFTASSRLGTYTVDTIATGIVTPWAVALLPDGSFLVTERGGNLRRVSAAGTVSAPLAGMPAVYANGQGGLLDVALSPDFASDSTIFFSFAEEGANSTAGTAVARAVLGANAVSGVEVIFRQTPKLPGGQHFGSRLAFAPDGRLFVSLGERQDRIRAQRLEMLQGKIVRINPDGTIPADNPFRTQKAKRAIWSYGHRNPQSLAFDPRTGKLWQGEHGPLGGDEINWPQPGANYGWPLTSYGNDYATGQPYPEWVGTTAAGIEAPVYWWTQSSPGVSGMTFLVDQPDSAWNDNLFMGMLAYRRLVRLELDGDEIVDEERINLGNVRIRDVRAGADGRLYLVTDETNGRLLRITPPGA